MGIVDGVIQWFASNPLHTIAGAFTLGGIFGFWLRSKLASKPKKE